MSIQAVLLDADGVIQTRTESFPVALRGFLRDPRSVEEFLRDIFAAERPSLTGEGDFTADLKTVLECWNVDAPVEQVLKVWTLIKPIDGIKALTARLRLMGTQSCVASNQQSYRASYMSHVLGYQDIFDREFYSCDLGAAKPCPEFFELIVHTLKVDPSELLFIDDHAENIDGAIRTGIHAAVFDSSDHPDPAASLFHLISQYGARSQE